MPVTKGSRLARHQTVKMSRAAHGQNLFLVKAWHSDGARRRWVTIAYRKTQLEAYVYARGAAFHLGDRSVAVFHAGKKLKQWKGTVMAVCPNCRQQVEVTLERGKWGGK